MIDTNTLNQLLTEAFTNRITWLEASKRHPLEEFIETFYKTRALTEKTISDLTDEQVALIIQGSPAWSISEMVTHLIFSQNFYYNHLLDMATTQLPHILEAARGFGEGAQPNRPAAELRENLRQATERIHEAIEQTRLTYDPNKIVDTTRRFFGMVDYRTWILLLLGHEVDHVRQGIFMRRAARAKVALPPTPATVEPEVTPAPTPITPSATSAPSTLPPVEPIVPAPVEAALPVTPIPAPVVESVSTTTTPAPLSTPSDLQPQPSVDSTGSTLTENN